ncbi:hypothetical protein pb186bvf_000707 [Paramecium bursaria]
MNEGSDRLYIAILLEQQSKIEQQKSKIEQQQTKISELEAELQKYKQQIVELQKHCDQESVIMIQQDQINKDYGTSQYLSNEEQSEEENPPKAQFFYPPNIFQKEKKSSASKCEICQKEYVTDVNLQTHMRIIHKLPKKDKKTKNM